MAVYYGNYLNNIITGEQNEDNTLKGLEGNDTIFGGNKDDLIFGDGYKKRDKYEWKKVKSYGPFTYDDFISAQDGNDTVIAGKGDDFVQGGAGDDLVFGGKGNDFLKGDSGDDTIKGDYGDDVLVGDSGHDILKGYSGHDTLFGGTNNDSIYGGYGDDFARGGTGGDKMYGWSGDDTFGGDQGFDKIRGGYGNDFLEGGRGKDRVWGEQGDDTIFGFQDNFLELNANGQDDELKPERDADTLSGGNGNDLIYGQAGDDSIDGGALNDTLYGGNHNDTVKGGQGNDVIYGDGLAKDYDWNKQKDWCKCQYYGKEIGDDLLIGGTGDDDIYGGKGDDTLVGFDPAFSGKYEVDTLTGGKGADYFNVNVNASGNKITSPYSLDGDKDFVWILDFNGKGAPDPKDPLNNGDLGDGDKLVLLKDLKDFYVIRDTYDASIGKYGATVKELYLSKGFFGGKLFKDELIAKIVEPQGNFDLKNDVVFADSFNVH